MWFIPQAHLAGINTINDIYYFPNSKFLSYQELIDKYGRALDPVTYRSIVCAIPVLWKSILKQRIIGEKWS